MITVLNVFSLPRFTPNVSIDGSSSGFKLGSACQFEPRFPSVIFVAVLELTNGVPLFAKFSFVVIFEIKVDKAFSSSVNSGGVTDTVPLATTSPFAL